MRFLLIDEVLSLQLKINKLYVSDKSQIDEVTDENFGDSDNSDEVTDENFGDSERMVAAL